MISGKRNSFSLYIHFPWCIKKCPYCDFNSHVSFQPIPHQAYIDALIEDYRQMLPLIGTRKLSSIFMGGGTPSLFPPQDIERLLTEISKLTPIDQIEVTLEANPGTLDLKHIKGYRTAGINRLSLGVQSFNDESLLAIGRAHTANDAHLALETACNIFDRINIDLMFGLPQQTLAMGLYDLSTATEAGVEHLSWYQLTIEANTHFAKQTPVLPLAEKIEDLYELGLEFLETRGLRQYEISAYTRDKPSAHNVNYWSGGDYIGIGAGAHSKWTIDEKIERWSLWRLPKKYLAQPPEERKEWSASIPEADRMFEYFLNRTRMTGSLSWQEMADGSTLSTDFVKHWIDERKASLSNYMSITSFGIELHKNAMLFNRALLEVLVEPDQAR